MPRSIVQPTPGQALAIRTATKSGEKLLLAVPAMHPNTPRHVRVEVFELVLRRLPFEAVELAQRAAVEIERRNRDLDNIDIAALIAEKPHHTAKVRVAA